MKELLIELLSTFGYPVFLQGTLSPETPYPDDFFTFWNRDTEGAVYYDNDDHATEWEFDVNFYSNNPVNVNTKLDSAVQLLKSHGFIISGKGRDVASDEITHTGRGVTAYFLEN